MKLNRVLSLLVAVGLFLTACATPTAEVRIVKETVVVKEEVEKKVVETVVVEKQVDRKVVETVVVKEEVEKKVVETVEVEKIVEVTKAVEGVWYNPAELGKGWRNICVNTPPNYGGTLIMTGGAGRDYIDGVNDGYLFSQLFDRALDMSVQPDLAEEWEISDDGLVYTFYLRNDVVFHDGEPLTAEDIKYSIEMCTHPDTVCRSYRYAPLNKIVGAVEFQDGGADEISGIEILDDYTVQITLVEPRGELIPKLGLVNIWPEHIMGEIPYDEVNDSEYAKRPIASGPFKLEELVLDQYMIVVAHEDYHKGRPYLDRIIFRANVGNWISALEAGEIHVGGSSKGQDRVRLEGNPNLVVVGAVIPGAMALPVNTENVDLRVRKALYHALDREAMVQGLYYGGAQAILYTWQLSDPGGEWLSPDAANYPYDPEKAKELLAEAQADGAWDPNKELRLLSYYGGEVDLAALAAMQQYWADVGITVKIETMDSGTWIQRVYADGDFEMGYGCCYFKEVFDLNNFQCDKIYPEGWNSARFCNPEFDEFYNAGLVEGDPAKRAELLHKASSFIVEELPGIPLYNEIRKVAVSKEVCNYGYRQHTQPHPKGEPETWYLAGE